MNTSLKFILQIYLPEPQNATAGFEMSCIIDDTIDKREGVFGYDCYVPTHVLGLDQVIDCHSY
jgi:hypothetical protein